MSQPANGLKAVVFANGAAPDLHLCRPLLADADLVVAADGGARTLLGAGLPLTALLGDMDSLPAKLLARWRAGGGETLVFPAEKDETDLELALRYAVEHGARRITVLGALGGRVDHELANLLLLAAPLLDGLDAAILDAGVRVVAVRDRVELAGQPGDLLSLLPITAQVDSVMTEGLHYPLQGETLQLGPARGVSNVFLGNRATVRLTSGILLAIQTWMDQRPLDWR